MGFCDCCENDVDEIIVCEWCGQWLCQDCKDNVHFCPGDHIPGNSPAFDESDAVAVDLLRQIKDALVTADFEQVGKVLNEIDLYLTANDHADDPNLDGNIVMASAVDADTFRYVQKLDDLAYNITEDRRCFVFDPQVLKNYLTDTEGNDYLTQAEEMLKGVVDHALEVGATSLGIWQSGGVA